MKKISTTTTKKDEKVASQKLTIGLDLGDRWSWYCVLNEAGEVVLEQKVATTPKAMKEVFSGMPRSRLALETGTHSPWVSSGIEVSRLVKDSSLRPSGPRFPGRQRTASSRNRRSCQVDEYASLDCGVRAPNFMLAQELLEHGETEMVVTYLSQCKNIWRSFQLPISKLIGLIERGERVDLQTSEFVRALNQPSYKLQMQWMRACCLEEAEDNGDGNRVSEAAGRVTTTYLVDTLNPTGYSCCRAALNDRT